MIGKFFYNFNATKHGDYSKFSFGIVDIECDDEKDLTDEAFMEVRKYARETFPDADDINFTAFNKV